MLQATGYRLRAAAGKEVYGRQRIDPQASGFSTSPWAYNRKMFLASEDGDVYVIDAGPQFKILHKNSMGEMIAHTARFTVAGTWRDADERATLESVALLMRALYALNPTAEPWAHGRK